MNWNWNAIGIVLAWGVISWFFGALYGASNVAKQLNANGFAIVKRPEASE